jgi:catechol 2,3-dioxygenase-like lactoylglutathione lyase family enzyme
MRVDDFERAIAWYAGKLGFSVEKREEIEQLSVSIPLTSGVRAAFALKSPGVEKAAAMRTAKISWSSLSFAVGTISASQAMTLTPP